ncbi:unnamed protein product, partial [Didymodactylos carnosus]
MRGAGGAEDES